MKKSYLLITITLLLLGSCNEDFFDKYPKDKINEGNFFGNTSSIEMIVNDAYVSLRSFYENHYFIGEIASDNAFNQKFNNNYNAITINESNTTIDNGVILNLWNYAYTLINRANLALDHVNEVELPETEKDRLAGEALFLRSLMYLELVRIFGDVPLVFSDIKTGDEAFEKNERTASDKVYEQIISDLIDAVEKLEATGFPSSAEDMGRATAGSARALLGKVFLTRKEYAKAIEQFKKVIGYGKYSLLPNYEGIFDADNANNPEIIFAVQYARGFDPSMGNPLVRHAFPNETFSNTGILNFGNGMYLITDDLYNAFEQGDLRKNMINDQLSGKRPVYYFTKKYYDKGMADKVESGCDIIILRYADLLLMYAEAEAALGHTDAAFEYVRQIRGRAGLETPVELKENINLAIEKERRKELNCESHRWFDLLRTGRLKTVMNAHFASGADDDQIGTGGTIEDYELLFPIPKFEVDLSNGKLKQNTGY